MSNEEKDFSYLRDILSKMKNGEGRSAYDHFNYEEWNKDKKYTEDLFESFKKSRKPDLAPKPDYLTSKTNLISWIEPFSSDRFFQKKGHSLTLHHRVPTWYRLIYRSPKGDVSFALVQVKDFSPDGISWQICDVAETLYERVKPSLSSRIYSSLVK